MAAIPTAAENQGGRKGTTIQDRSGTPPAEAAEFLERANEEQTHANDLAGLLEAIEGAPG